MNWLLRSRASPLWSPKSITAKSSVLKFVPPLLQHHQLQNSNNKPYHLQPHLSHSRPFSSQTSPKLSPFRPPRFNSRTPSSRRGLLWGLVPDGAKMFLGLVGGCAFLMVAGPVFFIVVPPMVLGMFLLRRLMLKRRSRDMSQRWQQMLETNLTYRGSEFDEQLLEKFTLGRIVEALEMNEKDIINSLSLDIDSGSHRSPASRFELTPILDVQENLQLSNTMQTGKVMRLYSYDLLDKETGSAEKVAAVTVALTSEWAPNSIYDPLSRPAIIEIKPLLPFKKPVILNTEGILKDGPYINIKAKRSRVYDN